MKSESVERTPRWAVLGLILVALGGMGVVHLASAETVMVSAIVAGEVA